MIGILSVPTDCADEPYWRLRLDADGQHEQAAVFDRDLLIQGQPLYPRVEYLVGAWLGLHELVEAQLRTALHCFFPAFGPRFTNVAFEAGRVTFAVDGLARGASAELKVASRDRTDRSTFTSVPERNGAASIQLREDEPPVRLEAILVEGRSASDSFVETPSYCSWTAPILHHSHTSKAELTEDLVRGECLTVEFKEWVEPNTKNTDRVAQNVRHDILRTVSAFANTRGGRIIIGVSDYLVVLGIADRLGAWKAGLDDKTRDKLPSDLKQGYARVMRKFLSDELHPESPASVKCETLDGHTVCVIEVPIFERVVSLRKDGFTCVRRGSNNVTVPADAPELQGKLHRKPFGL